MTTLENLYNGNINPSDLDELKYNPEYSRALNLVCVARQKLTDSLSAEQRELLERYITNADEISVIMDEAIFNMFLLWLMNGCTETPEELADRMNDILIK